MLEFFWYIAASKFSKKAISFVQLSICHISTKLLSTIQIILYISITIIRKSFNSFSGRIFIIESIGLYAELNNGNLFKLKNLFFSIAETAKSNGVNFYEYRKKLLTDLMNLDIHQNPEILD